MVNFKQHFSSKGCTVYWSSTELYHFATIFQFVSMGIKNFETGILVEKFDPGSAIYVEFFFQKRTLTRRPLALDYFKPTKFSKKCFNNTKEMQYDYRTKFLRKIQVSKLHFFMKLFFQDFLLRICCHVSRRKKCRIFRKILHLWFRKFFENSILVKFYKSLFFFQKLGNLQ